MKAWLSIVLFLLISTNLLGQNALREAEQLSQAREYAVSSQRLLDFIDTHPQRKYDLGRAWALHSFNLLQQDQTEAAREANEKSFELRRQLRSPEITENYLRTAEIAVATKNYEEALVAAEQGVQMLIENPRVYANLNFYAAKALHELKKPLAADEYFNTARNVLLIEVGPQDPAYAQLLYQGALMQEERHAYAEAFELLSTAYHTTNTPLLKTRLLIKAYQMYWLNKKAS